MCRQALQLWRDEAGEGGGANPPRVLDPAVGDGIFLSQMHTVWTESAASSARSGGTACPANIRLDGVDIRPDILESARERLPEARLTAGNFLLDDPPAAGGYDIIIGNPPYLGQRDVRRLDYGAALFDRYGFRDDLYVYFIRRALDRLKPGGVLAMVTSDSWLTLESKQPLRDELLRHRLDHVIRLPERTFDRRIYACCFALTRDRPPREMRYGEASFYRPSDAEFRIDRLLEVPQKVYLDSPGRVLYRPDREHIRLARRLGATLARWQPDPQVPGDDGEPWSVGGFVPLREIAQVLDVGIHSRNCRPRLFFSERGDGMERLLQGRQIERWRVRWEAPEAHYRWVDLGYQPRAGVKGVGRNGRPSRLDEYWEFQGDPQIHRVPDRILIRQTGDQIVAAYLHQDRTPHYTDNTLFTCLLSERAKQWGIGYHYLLGYLNSVALNRVYRFLSQEQSKRQAQVKIRWLRILPFRLPSKSGAAHVDAVVRRIIEAVGRHDRTGAAALIAECDAHFDSWLGGEETIERCTPHAQQSSRS